MRPRRLKARLPSTLQEIPAGTILRIARRRAGLRLVATAAAAGCSHTLIALIEMGKRSICTENAALDLEGWLVAIEATVEERERVLEEVGRCRWRKT